MLIRMKKSILKFLRITISDIECYVFYLAAGVSTVLLYFILGISGELNPKNFLDVLAYILIAPVILLACTPIFYKRYKIINEMLLNGERYIIDNEDVSFVIGIFIIRCEFEIKGTAHEIWIIKNKTNLAITRMRPLTVIRDAKINEFILEEVFHGGAIGSGL